MQKQHRILAIDDEQVILDSIVKLCAAEGWLVNDRIDAEKGLEALKQDSYDLIITDIMMPGMDGFELLETLRKQEIRTPVIVTTGFSTLENAVRSLYTGAIDFLPKPFTFDELISVIGRGLKYSDIQAKIQTQSVDSDFVMSDEVIFIPCPPKYKRLGYSSWTHPDDDGSIRVGITDLFLRTIEPVTRIELMQIDDDVYQGNACCQVETEDQLIHNIVAPLSGKIIQRNEAVMENYNLLEKDPYFAGWMYTIVPSDPDDELKHLVPCSSDRI